MRGKTSTVRKSVSVSESSGLQSGLTELDGFMADGIYNDASFNESSSGASGRSTSGGGFSRDAKGRRGSKSASEKGYSFEIEGCK